MPRDREKSYRNRLRDQKERLRVLLELPRMSHESQILDAAIKFVEKNKENKENEPNSQTSSNSQPNSQTNSQSQPNSQTNSQSSLDFFHLLKASNVKK
jgi:hypothetical protein